MDPLNFTYLVEDTLVDPVLYHDDINSFIQHLQHLKYIPSVYRKIYFLGFYLNQNLVCKGRGSLYFFQSYTVQVIQIEVNRLFRLKTTI